jgi:hypothetical protein
LLGASDAQKVSEKRKQGVQMLTIIAALIFATLLWFKLKVLDHPLVHLKNAQGEKIWVEPLFGKKYQPLSREDKLFVMWDNFSPFLYYFKLLTFFGY